MKDNLRPRGSVEVPCSGIGCRLPPGEGQWFFWVEALDPRLPDGPFVCGQCQGLERCERETGRKVRQVRTPAQATKEHPGGELISWVFADSGEPIPATYTDTIPKGDRP